MQSTMLADEYWDEDIPTYRKFKKRPPCKKADHKHVYEPVPKSQTMFDKPILRCTICGHFKYP